MSNFKTFDRVLVRDELDKPWRASIFSHYNDSSHKDIYPYITINNTEYRYCIPYEGNESLFNTTKDAENKDKITRFKYLDKVLVWNKYEEYKETALFIRQSPTREGIMRYVVRLYDEEDEYICDDYETYMHCEKQED